MKPWKLISITVLALLAGLAMPALEAQSDRLGRHAEMITFNAPGAGTGSGQGTLPNNINPQGAITGYYADANNVTHGFLRARDGTFTTFEAPGAATNPGQGTFSFDVSPAGAITGF